MSNDLRKCSGCGCVTDGRCHVDVAGFTCGQPLCDDCTHVDQRYSWTHEQKNALADMIEKLEAKLERAMGELKSFTDVSLYMQSSSSYSKHRHENSVTDTIWSQWSKQMRSSRRTLAELKEKRNE